PTEAIVYLVAEHGDWPARLGGRQKRVLDELLEARRQGVEPLTLEQLTHHSGASRDTIKRLAGRELIRLDARPVTLPELSDEAGEDPFEINKDQKDVLAAMEGKLAGGFSATLLHGVTGSGKTEVYVRAIREVAAAGKQAILLVPEIALATQTLQRLLQRLPRVAVLHSGLTDVQRAFYYEQIATGEASVVVGPRSAVFAPTKRLGLIVVDEEHEPTYKQDNVPRYHARDVAVKRASLEGAPILLGSATPSLESYQNAQQGRYDLLRLPKRVRGLPMPSLSIVHLRKEMDPGRIELIGKTLTRRMAEVLDRGEQIILLMNRRGYASFVFCPKCKWEMKCDHCERSMVFHQATQLAMCHYCQHTAALPDHCPACGGKLLLFGMGIQRVEGELARKFPEARVARMDSDTMTSPKQFQKVFDAFSGGELDILLGTQMVGKGLDFPGVSLVGVISADTSLTIPDFRAAERTFQLIVQVAGRAGRAEHAGDVVVQTLHADEPAVKLAAQHDYDGFVKEELPTRQAAELPPATRMVRFIVRDRSSAKVAESAEALAAKLKALLGDHVLAFYGPQPAGVPRIRDHYRWQILVIVAAAGAVQRIVFPLMAELGREIHSEIVADVDPVNLI
ncbi:MAG: replication restart helicase PriA, partial [Planctomycetota bacterium]